MSLVMRLWNSRWSTLTPRVSSGCSTPELISRSCCIILSMILIACTLIEALIYGTRGGLRLILLLQWHKVWVAETSCSSVTTIEVLLLWRDVVSGLRSRSLFSWKIGVVHIVENLRKDWFRIIQGRLTFVRLRGLTLDLGILSLQLVHCIIRACLLLRWIHVASSRINTLSTSELLETTLIRSSSSCHEIYFHVLLMSGVCTSVVTFVHI